MPLPDINSDDLSCTEIDSKRDINGRCSLLAGQNGRRFHTLCKEKIVDHCQQDNGKNATQRVSADADIDMLMCAGDLSHSAPV